MLKAAAGTGLTRVLHGGCGWGEIYQALTVENLD